MSPPTLRELETFLACFGATIDGFSIEKNIGRGCFFSAWKKRS
jgi:hypothetical protein